MKTCYDSGMENFIFEVCFEWQLSCATNFPVITDCTRFIVCFMRILQFRIQVVTDKAIHLPPQPRVREVVVPTSYRYVLLSVLILLGFLFASWYKLFSFFVLLQIISIPEQKVVRNSRRGLFNTVLKTTSTSFKWAFGLILLVWSQAYTLLSWFRILHCFQDNDWIVHLDEETLLTTNAVSIPTFFFSVGR